MRNQFGTQHNQNQFPSSISERKDFHNQLYNSPQSMTSIQPIPTFNHICQQISNNNQSNHISQPIQNYNPFQYASPAGYQYQHISQIPTNSNNNFIDHPLISTRNNSSNYYKSPSSFHNDFKPLRRTEQSISNRSVIIRQQPLLIEDYDDHNGQFSKVCKYQNQIAYDINVDDDKHIHKTCGNWC